MELKIICKRKVTTSNDMSKKILIARNKIQNNYVHKNITCNIDLLYNIKIYIIKDIL